MTDIQEKMWDVLVEMSGEECCKSVCKFLW